MRVLPLIPIGCAFVAASLQAAYKDDVRYNELANELSLRGLNMPTGAGVGVTQVEAGGSNYLPNADDSEFALKTITDQTGGGATSSHATSVGKNLYGNSISMAPGITEIDVYSASDWLNNQGWNSGIPQTEPNPLQNHSWISSDETTNATLRMDYAVERDGFLPVVGLNNGSSTTVPAVYASIYNGISVGRSDGEHSRGGTLYDTAGRTKPELVTPSGATSYTTPQATAAAAMLIESAGLVENAKDQLTLKALLLAGADKSPFADWDQTTARPIDDIYGAGQLDVYEAYFIQQAGQQAAGTTIDQRGWNLATLAKNSNHDYLLTVPAGFELRNLSVLLTWNRQVAYSNKFGGTYSGTLADYSLTLIEDAGNTEVQSSDSPVDNIEHIWRDSSEGLTPGNYTLTVATDTDTTYAIAWRGELYQDYALWSDSAFTSTPVADRDATDDPDNDGIENLLEQAFGGDPESSDPEILPTSQTVIVDGNAYLEISFRKPSFENNLTYTVETVTDLNGTWSSQTADITLQSITEEAGDYDRYTYRRVAPVAAESKAFLRVSVSQ